MLPVEEKSASAASLRDKLCSMESAFDAAPIGLCVLDLDFRYTTVNLCFLRMYGLTKAHFIGRTVEEALPGPASQIMAHLRDALAKDATVEREISLESPTAVDSITYSEDVIFLRTAQPIRDEAGRVYGIAVALLDITERKKIEAALLETKENLRHTVELTPHVPWTADALGELTFMSARWNTVTGKSGRVVHLKQWFALLHPEDVQLTTETWRHSVSTGKPYDAEYRVRSTDGGWRWLRARAYPRHNASGVIVRWYGTVEDVHESKSIAMELAVANEELARRAHEDYLTALPNRRRFDDVLEQEINRARRSRQPLAVIVLDIDHFKRYNDTAGHLVGDECLRLVARTIAGIVRRPSDLVARFGGDEFAFILPETAPSGAVEVADRVVRAVREIEIEHPDSRIRKVTVSAGVAVHSGGEYLATKDCAITLFEAADGALYEAKAKGRDCFATKSI